MKEFHDYVVTITKVVNTTNNEKIQFKRYLAVSENGLFYQDESLSNALVFHSYRAAILTAKKYKNNCCIFTDKVYPARLEEEESAGK